MLRRFIAPFAVAGLLSGCATLPAPDSAADSAFEGAVSAADPRAEAAGMAMLRRGGSATDAAIAVMLALTVVEPQSSGIGGGGFLVRGTAEGSIESFDGRETAPAAATPEWFLAEDGSLPPFPESRQSGLSVGVPGNIAMAAMAHAEHGRLPWSALFDPAIALAREGFRINPRLNSSIDGTAERAGSSEAGKALYFDGAGAARAVGERVINEDLARTFEAIAAAGPEAFYQGPRAESLAQTVAQATPHEAAMTAGDVASYQPKSRDPVCRDYRGYRICGMGPPTSGGVAVLQILGMLERFDLAGLGVDNPETWHLFLEAQRLAYADREIYLADSDFVDVPVAGLLANGYLQERSALIDPTGSLTDVAAGIPAGVSMAYADGDEPEEHGTSHFAVVDREETMVSYTSTIESAFGSGLMSGGFFLNNELTDFSRSPVVDGRPVANRVEGGKRPRSSMSPMVVWDPQGRPILAVGAAGGTTIPVQVARSIMGVIDFGLSAEDALGLPFIMAFGDTVMVEQGTWLETASAQFESLGHAEITVRPAPVKGGAVLRRDGRWESARDPRLEGQLELP